jgi:multimeric flavodoxin WrbA
MPVKILGINGSPHTAGNTAYALDYALAVCRKKGARTQAIHLGKLKIGPCRGCRACRENARCVFHDGMDKIYPKLEWCDGLILASPVYLGMVSGQMKTMMDRTVVFRPSFKLRGKVGAGIACGAFRNGGQELVLANLHTYLLQMDLLVVSDGPPFAHSGGTVCGKAAEDELGLQTVANTASRLVEAARRLAGNPS